MCVCLFSVLNVMTLPRSRMNIKKSKEGGGVLFTEVTAQYQLGVIFFVSKQHLSITLLMSLCVDQVQ